MNRDLAFARLSEFCYNDKDMKKKLDGLPAFEAEFKWRLVIG